jgi:hypothetical protein
MQPVAQALDVLQSDADCYMGILLPTLLALKKKLNATKNELKLKSMISLVNALLGGIHRRFGSYFL